MNTQDNHFNQEDASQTSNGLTGLHRRKRQNHGTRRHSGSWVGGGILILLGLILILQNTGNFQLKNWWALFILIPAGAAFGRGINLLQKTEHSKKSAYGAFFTAGIITILSMVFLFELNWEHFGPILLILAGIGLFLPQLMIKK